MSTYSKDFSVEFNIADLLLIQESLEFIVNDQLLILSCSNPQFMSPEKSVLSYIPQEKIAIFKEKFQLSCSGKKTSFGFKIIINSVTKDEVTFHVSITPLMNSSSTLNALIIRFENLQDVDEKQISLQDDTFQKTILDISVGLGACNHSELDQKITQSLQSVCNQKEVDRGYFYLYDQNSQYFTKNNEWCSSEFSTPYEELSIISISNIPWIADQLLSFNDCILSDLNGDLGQSLNTEDTQSVIFIPIEKDSQLKGFLRFDALIHKKQWSEDEVDHLKMLGSIFFNAVEKSVNTQQSILPTDQYRQLLDKANDAILLIDLESLKILESNEQASKIYGYTKSELVNSSFNIFSDGNAGYHIEKLKKEKETRFEVIHYRKNRSPIFIEVNASIIQFNQKKCILSINRDITDSKMANKKIKLANERLQVFSDLTSDYTYSFVKQQGKLEIEWISNSIKTEFLKGDRLDWTHLIHPDDQEKIHDIASAIKKEEPIILQFRVINKWRKVKWIENASLPIFNDNEELIKVIGTAKDITKRKNAELNLIESKNQYVELFESASDGIFIHDMKGKFLNVNKVACEQSGYEKKELLKMKPTELDYGEEQELFKERMSILLKKKSLIFETKHRRKDGSVVPLEISSHCINYQGKEAIMSHARDITKRKIAEEKLKKELLLTSALSEITHYAFEEKFNLEEIANKVLSFAILLTESNAGLLTINDSVSEDCRAIFQEKNSENPGKFELWSNLQLDNSLWDYAIHQNQPIFINDPSNFEKYNATPLKNIASMPVVINNHHIGFIVVADNGQQFNKEHNILLQKISESFRLVVQNHRFSKELKQSNQELNQFMFNISNELSGPLASIGGLINIMRLTQLNQDNADYLDHIEDYVLKLRTFNKNILSHSSNLNSKILINKINFKKILNKCFAEAELKTTIIYQKKLSVEDFLFFGDSSRIQEIFNIIISNSISNLIQDRDHNEIQVEVKKIDEQAHIVVSHNGKSIDPSKLDNIFSIDFDNKTSIGPGIEFFVLKQSVHQLNGTIHVSSLTGEGSIFTIKLPNAVAKKS